jgi:hypothetical protein
MVRLIFGVMLLRCIEDMDTEFCFWSSVMITIYHWRFCGRYAKHYWFLESLEEVARHPSPGNLHVTQSVNSNRSNRFQLFKLIALCCHAENEDDPSITLIQNSLIVKLVQSYDHSMANLMTSLISKITRWFPDQRDIYFNKSFLISYTLFGFIDCFR